MSHVEWSRVLVMCCCVVTCVEKSRGARGVCLCALFCMDYYADLTLALSALVIRKTFLRV